MSTIVLKSFHHLYKLLKVYLALGFLGALSVVTWALITAYQSVTNVLVLTMTLLIVGLFLVNKLILLRRRPPAIADLVLYSITSEEFSKLLIGDLHRCYYAHLTHHSAEPHRQEKNQRWRGGHLYLWYWKQVLTSIIPLLDFQYRMGHTMLHASDITIDVTNEVRNRLKKILPFYRNQESRMTSASFFNDLWP
jgi:hypothetical protein